MAVLPWIAAAVAVAAIAGALVFAAVRGIRLWRELRSFAGPVTDALDAVAASADRAAEKAEALGGVGEPLARSVERLARSRARLAVLTSAIDEVRDAAEGVVLRK